MVKQIKPFHVFDRWGNQVYRENRDSLLLAATGWTGNVNGKHSPEGVYIWVSEVIWKDGKKEILRGEVTLLRN